MTSAKTLAESVASNQYSIILRDTSEFFDRMSKSWDSAHGPGSPRAREFFTRIAYLRRLCAKLGRPAVLDVGCGTGQHLLHIANLIASGQGTDFAPGMIESALSNRRKSSFGCRVEFSVSAVEDLSTSKYGGFDLVIFLGSLEHMIQPLEALRQIRSMLKPDGRILVVMPYPRVPPADCVGLLQGWSGGARPHHIWPEDLARIVARQGLVLESHARLPYLEDPPQIGEPDAFNGPGPTNRARARGAYAVRLRSFRS